MKHAHPQKEEAGRDHESQEEKLMQELYDYILNETLKKSSIFLKVKELFDKLNVKIVPIPLKAFSKTPAIDGWTEDSYNPSLFSWARHYGNIGIIPGKSNLLIFDCDTQDTAQFFENFAQEIGLDLNTLIIKTRRGKHYYYYCTFSSELERKKYANGNIKLDIIAGNKYQVVAPYSLLKLNENGEILNPQAENYILFEYTPINVPERLQEITHEQYEKIIEELNRQFKKTQIEIQKTQVKTELQERELTDEEIEKLIEIIQPYWQEGYRQFFLLYLSGFLRKDLEISEDSVIKLYEYFIPGDDRQDIKDRIRAIIKTYEKDSKVVAGKSKLIEILGKKAANELCRKIKQALNISNTEDELESLLESLDIKEKEAISLKMRKYLFANFELWENQFGEPYISLSPVKHLKVESKDFKDFVQETSINIFNQAVHNAAMDEIISFCRYKAKSENKQYHVYTRIGYCEEENFIEVNLLREDSKILRISPDGIELDIPKLKFIANKHMLPITFDYDLFKSLKPEDFTENVVFDLFSKVFNIQSREELALLIGWMLKTFYPRGEYPILLILGEREGVGKSTTCKFIVQLLDPCKSPLKRVPRTVDDLYSLAKNNFILCFDNLSYISDDLSDALCQLSTGGSLSKRKLYTDAEIVDLPLKNPLILNSIYSIAQRRDLRRRCITLELKKPVEPKTLQELEKNFKEVATLIYSYLVFCVQEALKQKEIELKPLDIADTCYFVAKAYPVFFMDGNEFIQTLQENREELAREILESNILVQVIREKLEQETLGIWKTTARELLDELKKRYGNEKNIKLPSPEGIGKELKRLISDLEAINIKTEFIRTRKKRLIVFSYINPNSNINEEDLPF